MTRAIGAAPVAWPRAFRLAQALGRIGGIGNPAILVLMVVWLALVGFIGLTSQAKLGHANGLGVIWFVLTAYYLHFATGLCNRGWRMLAATAHERRAAAWMLVSLLPLLVALASTLLDIGLAAFVGESDVARRGLIQFALRGLAMQGYAAMAICFGNWPDTAVAQWQVDRRQPRDWLMYGVMGLITVGMIVYGDRFAALPGAGPTGAILAVGLCALLLPVALRVARLDQQQSSGGTLDGLSDAAQSVFGMRLSGWSGHFVREARRTALLWAWFAVITLGMSRLVPGPGGLDPHDAAFREGMRQGMTFGMASLVWATPAMAAALLANLTQQYLFRARLLLLSLPHGDRLILLTPLFNAALVFVATFALIRPQIMAEPIWAVKVAASVLYGLAMIYTGFACNLGATTYARVLTNSLVISLPLIGIGAFGAMSKLDPALARSTLVPISGVSLIVLVMALVWCRWQLRSTRAPYRPWPGAAGGWRTA